MTASRGQPEWATERKHLALVDVAEAGGWLLAVMNEDRKVRDVAVIDRA